MNHLNLELTEQQAIELNEILSSLEQEASPAYTKSAAAMHETITNWINASVTHQKPIDESDRLQQLEFSTRGAITEYLRELKKKHGAE